MAQSIAHQDQHPLCSPRGTGIRSLPLFGRRVFQNPARINQLGQASIEFVLLLVIILLLLHTLVLPNYFLSKEIISDSQQFAQVRLNAQQLATAINDVSAGGIGSKRTVRILLTDRSFLGCTDKGNTSWYPDSWGDQRLSFHIFLNNTQSPPIALPFSDDPSNPFYSVMTKNGGGCNIYPPYDPSDPDQLQYLQCFGTIPVNADCTTMTINDPINSPINVCGSFFPVSSSCGSVTHNPQIVRVEIVKQTDGSVTVTSAVENEV